MENTNLILTPFSMSAVLLYHKLKNKGKKIHCFMENTFLRNGERYDEVFIKHRFYLSGAKVILCCSTHQEEIRAELQNLGYRNEDILDERDFFPDDIFEDISAAGDVLLDRLEALPLSYREMDIILLKQYHAMNQSGALDYPDITRDSLQRVNPINVFHDRAGGIHLWLPVGTSITTSRCTLRCEKCCGLIPYFKQHFTMPKEQILNDFNRLLSQVDWIGHQDVVGGEPFLYEDLDYVLDGMYQNPETAKKVGMLRLITNGTVLPSDRILRALHRTHTRVYISNYGKTSSKIDQLTDLLSSYDIFWYAMNMTDWINCYQYVDAKSYLTNEQLLQIRKTGCLQECRAILDGRFYLCGHLAMADKLCALPPDLREGASVDLYAEDFKAQCEEYLSLDRPLPQACSFCNGAPLDSLTNPKYKIPAAVQAKAPLPYTKYESR